MKKTYNLTDKEVDMINIGKKYFNEKTEVEAIKKMLNGFIRMNWLPSRDFRWLNGFYWEMPIVRIWDIKISQLTDKKWETGICFDISEVESGWESMIISPDHKAEKDGKTLEQDLIDIFNKHF